MARRAAKLSNSWRGVIAEYADFLPVTDETPVITLLEGATPLIESVSIADSLPANLRIFFKHEGMNPTGSFKDRGMTMAVSKAIEGGARMCMCASTGNTSAAAAAYSARSELACVVLIPEGKIALGKLAQALTHGARTVQIRGNFDDCLDLVREITDNYPVELVNSINPYRMEGQKTAAFEVCDVLGGPPDFHALPVGNAGNISAYWWGYCEYEEAGITDRTPTMLGFQAAGACPMVTGCPEPEPETIATAIRIGNPARWEDAQDAVDSSGGLVRAVSDDEIIAAYQRLAAEEGVFIEPASAASIAGVTKLAEEGYFGDESATIVCTVTGHGLKDPDTAVSVAPEPEKCDNDLDMLIDMLGL